MWADIDFSKLDIRIIIEDMAFRIVSVENTHFYTNFPNHMHSFYELHYVANGQGTLITNDISYELQKGCLYLTGPKVSHMQLTDPQNILEEYAFSFDVTFYKGKTASSFSDILQSSNFWYGTDRNQIDEIFFGIGMEAKNKSIGHTYMIKSLSEQLIIKMLRNIYKGANVKERKENLPDDRRKFLIDRAFIYHYKDITLVSLAKLLNLSPRQTSRVIQQEYGMSFLDLRTKSRLDAAYAQLHADNGKSIQEIAEDVGFNNTIYFSKLFLKAYGATPSEIRKNL